MSEERPTEEMPEPPAAGAADTETTRVDDAAHSEQEGWEPEAREPEPGDREPDTPPRFTARSELPFGLVFMLLLALLIVVFAVQNTQTVRIQFLVWDTRFPLAVVIIAVVVATTIVVELLGLVFRRRRRKRIAERAELDRLRKLQKR